MPEEKALVVPFAFATPPRARANVQLREHVGYMLSVDHIYTQPDLAEGLEGNVEVIPENPGEPSPTLRIARGAVAFAQKIGATQIRIVAAKPHQWRCRRDVLEALNEAGISIPVFVEHIDGIGWWEWFHPSSTQPRTRSPWAWLLREIPLRLMPFFIYKRIAG